MKTFMNFNEDYSSIIHNYVDRNRSGLKDKARLSTLEIFFVAIFSCIIIHAIYFAMFKANNVPELAYFNLGSVIFYILIFILANKGWPTFSFMFMHGEVVIYSIFATVYLGWQAGFSYLIICFLGTLNIVTLKIPCSKYILGLIEILIFFMLRKYCVNHEAIYFGKLKPQFVELLFTYNVTIYFIEVIVLSMFNSSTTLWLQRKLIEQNIDLYKLASTDQLTQLYNRRIMLEHLEKLQSESLINKKHFSIAICDIDNFKKINDTFGHQCGDYVLEEVASIVMKNIGGEDIPCRWGGEELLFIFPEVDINNATNKVEILRKEIEAFDFYYDDKRLQVTLTFGVCTSEKFETIDNMITEADRLLYIGKTSGKNCVIY